jgi:DNA-binding transcriptional regulator YdaS (Cro superfamily)
MENACKQAIERVTRHVGSQKELARLLGVTSGAVCQWNAFPAKYLPRLVEITGFPEWELRPDIIRDPRASQGL